MKALLLAQNDVAGLIVKRSSHHTKSKIYADAVNLYEESGAHDVIVVEQKDIKWLIDQLQTVGGLK